jgi:PadR family transcriptional regulator PadR
MGRIGEKRKAKYCHLTAAGNKQLHAETEKWNRMTDLIGGILGTVPEEL